MSPEERLAAARAYVTRAKAAASPPVHLLDQLRAASRDARGFTERLSDALSAQATEKWSTHLGRPGEEAPDEVAARVLVAFAGLRLCPHLKGKGPQPACARLALHRLDCGRCLLTVRKPPAGEDDRCDWCGGRGVEVFQPIVIQMGPAIVIGDACEPCASALRWFDREPVK